MALALVPVLPVAGHAIQGIPQNGPDIPAALPVASLTPFEDDEWTFRGGVKTAMITVPDVPWTRVVLTYENHPIGDPWDRLFMVAVGGVEVLHGTTPRTDFTVSKELTEFAAILPPGAEVPVAHTIGTWVGNPGFSITIRLDFYDDPLGLAMHKPNEIVPAWLWTSTNGHGSSRTTTVDFGDAPERAVIELTTSGHGTEEFWYQSPLFPPSPREYHLFVGDHEVGTIVMMPYIYALLGFCSGEPYPWGCTLQPFDRMYTHRAMWWTAQQVLDAAGIHTGVGEVPPYRIEVPPEHLPLLAGQQEVRLVQERGYGSWITSVTFLMDDQLVL